MGPVGRKRLRGENRPRVRPMSCGNGTFSPLLWPLLRRTPVGYHGTLDKIFAKNPAVGVSINSLPIELRVLPPCTEILTSVLAIDFFFPPPPDGGGGASNFFLSPATWPLLRSLWGSDPRPACHLDSPWGSDPRLVRFSQQSHR